MISELGPCVFHILIILTRLIFSRWLHTSSNYILKMSVYCVLNVNHVQTTSIKNFQKHIYSYNIFRMGHTNQTLCLTTLHCLIKNIFMFWFLHGTARTLHIYIERCLRDFLRWYSQYIEIREHAEIFHGKWNTKISWKFRSLLFGNISLKFHEHFM